MTSDTFASRLREAIEVANIPSLIPVLVQLTGDLRWLEDPYKPERNRGLGDNPTGGLPEEVQREIRSAAYDAILQWHDEGKLALEDPPRDLLARMLTVAMGEEVPPEYGPMIAAELGLLDEEEAPVNVPDGFEVLVIGAGVSGIAAAVKLKAAGIPFRVIEREASPGGTWLVNRYPGCGVDTPSALYSFGFAPHAWSKHFALRDELYGYLVDVVEQQGLNDHIAFGVEATDARYDEDRQRWDVTLRGPDGDESTICPSVVISAVGAFAAPRWPQIPGLSDFPGPCVHTADWPEDLDLSGKRVAVIGNGASAMQLVPAIADQVASMTIFQRSPQWIAPFEQFHEPQPEPLGWLNQEVPLYRLWYRLRSAWTFNDRVHPTLQKDPDWPHPERSLNAVNDAFRRFFTRYIEAEIGDRPDLLAKVVPTYPPYGKRILLDNGWYRTLTRDHVQLVTDPIDSVEGGAVVTRDGERHEVDVIVCATGFEVARFLASVDVRGRDGQSLREVWDDDDARAYLGLAVPGFPNFFIVFGPNTQTGHGGSLIGTAEIQLQHIMRLVRGMLAGSYGEIECRQDLFDEYNERVDAAHERMVWTHPGMDTYYRNARGRVVFPNPFRVVDFWQMAREIGLDDYTVQPSIERMAGATDET